MLKLLIATVLYMCLLLNGVVVWATIEISFWFLLLAPLSLGMLITFILRAIEDWNI